MASIPDQFDKQLQLMPSCYDHDTSYRSDSPVNKMIALMSSSNVNTYMGGEPLIVRYLRTCTKPNFNILTAFAKNGCDFNVRGDDGQTPLQLLIANEIYGSIPSLVS